MTRRNYQERSNPSIGTFMTLFLLLLTAFAKAANAELTMRKTEDEFTALEGIDESQLPLIPATNFKVTEKTPDLDTQDFAFEKTTEITPEDLASFNALTNSYTEISIEEVIANMASEFRVEYDPKQNLNHFLKTIAELYQDRHLLHLQHNNITQRAIDNLGQSVVATAAYIYKEFQNNNFQDRKSLKEFGEIIDNIAYKTTMFEPLIDQMTESDNYKPYQEMTIFAIGYQVYDELREPAKALFYIDALLDLNYYKSPHDFGNQEAFDNFVMSGKVIHEIEKTLISNSDRGMKLMFTGMLSVAMILALCSIIIPNRSPRATDSINLLEAGTQRSN